jgi:hypothetical protein
MLQNEIVYTLSHSFAGLRCFIFLISVRDVIILSILDSILNFEEKRIVHHLFHMPDIDTDAGSVPDKMIEIRPEPDPLH